MKVLKKALNENEFEAYLKEMRYPCINNVRPQYEAILQDILSTIDMVKMPSYIEYYNWYWIVKPNQGEGIKRVKHIDSIEKVIQDIKVNHKTYFDGKLTMIGYTHPKLINETVTMNHLATFMRKISDNYNKKAKFKFQVMEMMMDDVLHWIVVVEETWVVKQRQAGGVIREIPNKLYHVVDLGKC